MKIQKQVLVHICLLLPCAAAECSKDTDLEVMRNRWTSPVPVKMPVELSYVRLSSTSSESAIAFEVKEGRSSVAKIWFYERDGNFTKVSLDGHYRISWDASSPAEAFRLEKPTRLRLDYFGGRLSVSAYDEERGRWRDFYRDTVPTNGTGSLGLSLNAVEGDYQVHLPCRQQTGHDEARNNSADAQDKLAKSNDRFPEDQEESIASKAKCAEDQFKSSILLATTIVFFVLAVLLAGTVTFLCLPGRRARTNMRVNEEEQSVQQSMNANSTPARSQTDLPPPPFPPFLRFIPGNRPVDPRDSFYEIPRSFGFLNRRPATEELNQIYEN